MAWMPIGTGAYWHHHNLRPVHIGAYAYLRRRILTPRIGANSYPLQRTALIDIDA